MDKYFKNPKIMGWIALITLVVLIAFVYDSYKSKNFYGLLGASTPAAV